MHPIKLNPYPERVCRNFQSKNRYTSYKVLPLNFVGGISKVPASGSTTTRSSTNL